MEGSTILAITAAGALALSLFQMVFGGGWSLSKNLQGVEARLTDKIDNSEKRIEEQQHVASREFGETVAALKEHVRQVEFHLRDNYIRKDDFIVHMKAHDDLLRMNFANLTQRLERIEKTLDQKT